MEKKGFRQLKALPNRWQAFAVAALNGVVGGLVAHSLYLALNQPGPRLLEFSASPVRVTWSAVPPEDSSPAVAPEASSRVSAPEAPAQTAEVTSSSRVTPIQSEVAPVTKPVAPLPASKPTVEAPLQGLPTISQPPLPSVELSSGSGLPSIGGEGAEETSRRPTAPPETIVFPEFSLASVVAPGEGVLVLGLLVDDTGRVLNTHIVVSSGDFLYDLSLSVAYRGQRVEDIQPPLLLGEKRWLELRIDLTDTNSTPNLLP